MVRPGGSHASGAPLFDGGCPRRDARRLRRRVAGRSDSDVEHALRGEFIAFDDIPARLDDDEHRHDVADRVFRDAIRVRVGDDVVVVAGIDLDLDDIDTKHVDVIDLDDD